MAEAQNEGTVIGADTFIKGEMTAENKARILGRFEGTIKAKGSLEVAAKAMCNANVEARIVQIDGAMKGNISATEKVQLNAGAQVVGDIVAAKLVVAEGASLDGHFKVGPDALKNGAPKTSPSESTGRRDQAIPTVTTKPVGTAVKK